MSDITKRLKEKLASMTEEEQQQEWEKLKKYNDYGPTIEEYIQDLKYWGLYKE